MKKPTGTRTDESAESLVDVASIDQLAKIVSKYDLSEVEVDLGEFRDPRLARERLGRRSRRRRSRRRRPLAAAAIETPTGRRRRAGRRIADSVKSPMVGTAYLRPSPEAKPFVEIGATVKTGDKLLLVEAMKTFNDIVAPRGGKVVSITSKTGRRLSTASR